MEYLMGNFLDFLICSIFIATCRGFAYEELESDNEHFVKRSQLMWYYICTCPPQANDVEMARITENPDGYGKLDYRDDSTNCGCTRYWAAKGTSEACEGCDSEYPNFGENRFLFVNSCYCNGCTQNEAEAAMKEMMLREDSPDDFYYECYESQSKYSYENPDDNYCFCVTYSARRGSELAGCTRDIGWWPCPFNLQDYEYYEQSKEIIQLEPKEEIDRDIYRRK